MLYGARDAPIWEDLNEIWSSSFLHIAKDTHMKLQLPIGDLSDNATELTFSLVAPQDLIKSSSSWFTTPTNYVSSLEYRLYPEFLHRYDIECTVPACDSAKTPTIPTPQLSTIPADQPASAPATTPSTPQGAQHKVTTPAFSTRRVLARMDP